MDNPESNQDIDTQKNFLFTYSHISFLPTESTVAMQQEDNRLLIHESIVGNGSSDNNCRSYRRRMTEMENTITGTERHVKANPISADDYPRNEVSKANQPQVKDRFNTFVDHVTQLHKHEYSDKIENNEKN